jgi:hypothetical protein
MEPASAPPRRPHLAGFVQVRLFVRVAPRVVRAVRGSVAAAKARLTRLTPINAVGSALSRLQQKDVFAWVKAYGGNIYGPPTLVFGQEHGKPLFVARAFFNESVQPGKAARHLSGCNFPFAGREIIKTNYEILVLKPGFDFDLVLEWVPILEHANEGGVKGLIDKGYAPVRGGTDVDASPLYIAKVTPIRVFSPMVVSRGR